MIRSRVVTRHRKSVKLSFQPLTQGTRWSHSQLNVSNQCISRCLVNFARRDAMFTVELKDKPMKISRRFTLTMAIVAVVLYAAKAARSDELQIPERPVPAELSHEEWTMEIQPAVKLATVPSIPVEARSVVADEKTVFDPSAYARIYNSIPFNRAEYNVNPNYRHDSTMEILTGNARHQTIVQHNFEHKQPVKRIPAPGLPSRILTPFSSSGLLYGVPFGFGYGGLGYGSGSGRW